MHSKEEKSKTKTYLILITCVLFIFAVVILISSIINLQPSYATISNKQESDVKISQAQEVDISQIIDRNANKSEKQQVLVENVELEYITQYKENNDLPKGTIYVLQEGRTGLKTVTITKRYLEQEEKEIEQVQEEIVKSPINKIVEIGTGSGKLIKYDVKEGDTIYVTSDRLSVFLNNSFESQKVGTLEKDESMAVIQIEKEWYRVKTDRVIGWVLKEATTYKNPNANLEQQENERTVPEIKKKLSFNMNLNEPSGLSLEQFKKVLSDSKDKNNIFEKSAEYFYYIEQQYNINGVFVAAVGIHESAWGTSKLAKNKYNLFGYGASDSDPYNNAYSFDGYEESIDLIARVFAKYYLNPKGTSIYGGETANGRYYNGNTLSAVNKKYASDSNWANAVYSHMKYLYNKL